MVMPMFLAVPSTIFMAGSIVAQLRSGSLVSAISCKQTEQIMKACYFQRTEEALLPRPVQEDYLLYYVGLTCSHSHNLLQ